MTDFYSQNRCVCSTRSHGPLLCAFCLSFHFKTFQTHVINCNNISTVQFSEALGFSQYSSLTNTCKINLVYKPGALCKIATLVIISAN